MDTTAQRLPRAGSQWLGHPRGLATLFFTEMWERFSYYGMRALLLLYMTAEVNAGGLGLSVEASGAVYGLYTAAVYLSSLPGGWLADRVLGLRRSIFWGGVLISAGNLLLAVPGVKVFYLGLLLTCLGTGMLKPNTAVMVGELYRGDSASRRDAAFSIYYMGINIGALLAPFVAGTIGETAGYRWGFLSAGIAMVIGLVQYRATAGWLGEAGLVPQPATVAERARARRILTAGLTVLGVVILVALLGMLRLDPVQLAGAAGTVMVALAVLFFGSVFFSRNLTGAEKKRVAVIAIFFLCSALFWAGYEQAGTSLNLFARDETDRSFLGSWFPSGQHPVSWYQAPQAVFVLGFAPVFAWIWMRLGARGRDPSAGVKFGFGLVLLGASFAVMLLAVNLVIHSGHTVLPWWLIGAYFLQTLGELCLSPIGLSNVTGLAPQRYAGQMMGTWFLGMAIGNLAAGMMGGEASTTGAMHTQFLQMTLLGVVSGAIMLLIARPVYRWMTAAG